MCSLHRQLTHVEEFAMGVEEVLVQRYHLMDALDLGDMDKSWECDES